MKREGTNLKFDGAKLFFRCIRPRIKIMRGIMFLFVFAFLSRTSRTADQEKKLIGKWVGDLIDYKTKINLGKMYLEFTTDGNFLQTSVNGKERYLKNDL